MKGVKVKLLFQFTSVKTDESKKKIHGKNPTKKKTKCILNISNTKLALYV